MRRTFAKMFAMAQRGKAQLAKAKLAKANFAKAKQAGESVDAQQQQAFLIGIRMPMRACALFSSRSV